MKLFIPEKMAKNAPLLAHFNSLVVEGKYFHKYTFTSKFCPFGVGL